jgi:hypothetical protein
MTESETKKQLLLMLKSRTIGSMLHLLSELFGELANQSMRRRDEKKQKQQLEVAATLFVVGLGVDAACPRLENG